jgi:hypothetical protein
MCCSGFSTFSSDRGQKAGQQGVPQEQYGFSTFSSDRGQKEDIDRGYLQKGTASFSTFSSDRGQKEFVSQP